MTQVILRERDGASDPVLEPEPVPAHRYQVLMIRVHFGEALAQTAHKRINRLFGDATLGCV